MTSGNIGTGFTIKYNGTAYTVIKKGDVNSDGKVTSSDYVKIKNYIMGKGSLSSVSKSAADVNQDGKVTSSDYVKIKNYIMGKGTITI